MNTKTPRCRRDACTTTGKSQACVDMTASPGLHHDGTALLLSMLLALTLAGCGAGEEKGRIAGKVTFQGQPVSEGIVVFRGAEKGVHVTAELQLDGSYTVATAKGVGLPPGTYQVCVCPPVIHVPTTVGGAAPKIKQYPNIPVKYRDTKTSGLTLTVELGDNPFDIAM